MKLVRTKGFEKDYLSLSLGVRKRIDKQLKFLAANFRHPSIHAKKIKGVRDIWEGRITDFYRFTFKIKRNEIHLRRVGSHDKTLKVP